MPPLKTPMRLLFVLFLIALSFWWLRPLWDPPELPILSGQFTLVWSRNSAALSGRAWYGPKAPRWGTWYRGFRIYSDPSRMRPIRDQ